MSSFNYIQTFYCDPEAVNNSNEVTLTSVELFFRKKPVAGKNTSGTLAPGVIVSICEVDNDSPDVEKIVSYSTTRVDYDNIYTFSDASTPTIFSFPSPVVLKTGRFYGIVIKFEDTEYDVWKNKTGEFFVGTSTISPGSSNLRDGKFYESTNANVYRAHSDTDLKYRINVARYQANSATLEFVNKDYEFFTISGRLGEFRGGEYVYQNVANATGNIAVSATNTAIVGDGTDFTTITEGSYIVALNGANAQVLDVVYVVNATYLVTNTQPNFSNTAAKFKVAPVGKVYYKNNLSNTLYLEDSSANSSVKFTTSSLIKGEISLANATISTIDNLRVDQFVPKVAANTSSLSGVNVEHVLSYSNGSAYIVSNTNYETTSVNQHNGVAKYQGYILSRSNEVAESNLYNNKSAVIKVTFSIDGLGDEIYTAPFINTNEIDFFTIKNDINDAYVVGGYDTEITRNGNAISKGLSTKISFANNRFAEDIKVFLTGYRPANTEIRVYSKTHNSADSDSFDDKSWTPLTITSNANKYSSNENPNDLIEYEYSFPQYPESNTTLAGSFTTELANTIILAQGVTANATIAANDLVKVYNPLLPNNYIISIVTAANTTSITLAKPIANNNVVGTGFKVDQLKYKNTSFSNYTNHNICRYYNSAYNEYDQYDSLQVKIVFVANTTNIAPRVDQIQVIGVSA